MIADHLPLHRTSLNTTTLESHHLCCTGLSPSQHYQVGVMFQSENLDFLSAQTDPSYLTHDIYQSPAVHKNHFHAATAHITMKLLAVASSFRASMLSKKDFLCLEQC